MKTIYKVVRKSYDDLQCRFISAATSNAYRLGYKINTKREKVKGTVGIFCFTEIEDAGKYLAALHNHYNIAILECETDCKIRKLSFVSVGPFGFIILKKHYDNIKKSKYSQFRQNMVWGSVKAKEYCPAIKEKSQINTTDLEELASQILK